MVHNKSSTNKCHLRPIRSVLKLRLEFMLSLLLTLGKPPPPWWTPEDVDLFSRVVDTQQAGKHERTTAAGGSVEMKRRA